MKQEKIPAHVTEIGERDFWSSLRIPGNRKDTAPLKEAIRLGRRGDKTAAYTALAAYHRAALAREWWETREKRLKMTAPAPAALQDLLRLKINVWHGHMVRFDRKIDWAYPGSDLVGLHTLHWFAPALTAFIQTGEPRWRAFMIDILTQYDEAAHDPKLRRVLEPYVFEFQSVWTKWPILLACYLAFIHEEDPPLRALEGLLKTFLSFGRALDWKMREYEPAYNLLAVTIPTLLQIARVFPEFDESPRWDRKAVRLTVEHARKGYFKDGGNRERVWGYGIMHLEGLTRAYEVGRRYGGMGKRDREIRSAILRAGQWYAKTSGPSPQEWFPTYGDAGWGGWNCLKTIRDMTSFLQQSPDGVPAIAPGVPAIAPGATAGATAGSFGVDRTRSYLLKPSGFAVMRNGNDPDSAHININFGRFAGWHSHWDLLSMNLWSQGEPLLEELCRFGPYSNPLDQMFRAPESHNLMLIDGMVYDSRLVAGEDVQWFSNEIVDYFSAYHRAYRFFVYGRDASPVSPNIEAVVRRTILFVKNPGYVVVMDSVRDLNSATFNKAISQHWHSPFPFQVVGPGRVRTRGKRACLLVYAQTEGLYRLDTGTDFAGAEMGRYGGSYARYSLRARRWMAVDQHPGILGFTTVLHPFTGKMPEVQVRILPTQGGAAWVTEAIEVATPAGKDIIVLNPERRKGFAWSRGAAACRAYVKLGNRRGEQTIP
ncbi:MAG: heparinase II/III family protein [Lentisphaerae bacterium]|nr:heparinase II/III family protein [Lentisphaerota bacterium]